MKKIEEIDKNNKEITSIYQHAKKMIQTKNYSSAKTILENCLKSKDISIEKSFRIDFYMSLGICNFNLLKFIDSQDYFYKALDITNIYINDFNTEKIIHMKIKVSILMYLSILSLFQNKLSDSKNYFSRLEEMIINEDNIENKILLIRDVVKILFNIGVLKLKKKKSTLYEIDTIKKELALAPILMTQSRLTLLFNTLLKEDSTVLELLSYINEKWLEDKNVKLVKIAETITDQLLTAKPIIKIKTILTSEINKNSVKIDNIDEFLNDLKERCELIKIYFKKFNKFVILSSNNSKMESNKLLLPKISSSHKKLNVLPKNINSFLNSMNTNENDKEFKTPPKKDLEVKIFNSNSHREIPDLNPLTTSISSEQIQFISKKIEVKLSNTNLFKLNENNKRNQSNKEKLPFTKFMINNNIRRNSDNNNNNSNMISTREKLMLEKKKSRTEEVFIQVKNGNSFSLEEKVKTISTSILKAGSIKEALIHEKIDFKQIFEEIKESNSSNNYSKDPFNINLPNLVNKFCFKSKSGKKSNNQDKVNQDSYFIIENYMHIKNFYSFGVCDGHGLNGHFVSSHVKVYLPANFELIEINKILLNEEKTVNDQKAKKRETKTQINKSNYKQFYENNYGKLSFSVNIEAEKKIANNISEAFQKTHEDILDRDFNVEFSGSTICNIFLLGNILYCANVGDSRCVIGRYDNDKKMKALQISRDHKPDDPEENARILKNGGRVECFKSDENEDVGPARVWLHDEDIPGLAMSRSIGDTVAATVGVTFLPEIHKYKLTKNDKFIIIATDGIWEFISSEHAVQVVSKYWLNGDCDSATDELVRLATNFWEEKESVRDDITAIVIFIDSTNQK